MLVLVSNIFPFFLKFAARATGSPGLTLFYNCPLPLITGVRVEENSPVISSEAPSMQRNKVPPDTNNDVDFFEDSKAMEAEQAHKRTEVFINTPEDEDDIPCNQQQAILLKAGQAQIMEGTLQERTNRKQQLTLSGHLNLSSSEKGFQSTCSLNQQQMPPTNFTLESIGKKVIFIKCTDPNSVKLINNSIKIHKSASNSVLAP